MWWWSFRRLLAGLALFSGFFIAATGFWFSPWFLIPGGVLFLLGLRTFWRIRGAEAQWPGRFRIAAGWVGIAMAVTVLAFIPVGIIQHDTEYVVAAAVLGGGMLGVMILAMHSAYSRLLRLLSATETAWWLDGAPEDTRFPPFRGLP